MTDRDDIIRLMEWHPSFDRNQTNGLLARIERVAQAAAAAKRNRMISEGWRQCAQGQRATQHCAVAEQARLEEREACAKLCEDSINLEPYPTLTKMAAAIRAQAADRLARHGIQLPDENEEYGNPSF